MNFDQIAFQVESIRARQVLDKLNNYERRVLHADCELLCLDIEDFLKNNSDENENAKAQDFVEILTTIAVSAKLKFNNRKIGVWLSIADSLDEIIRTVATYSFLALSAAFLALPCVLFRPVDFILVKYGIVGSKHQISNICKCFIGTMIIKLAGIQLVVEGLDGAMFGELCSLVCFSHASTMDAFILSAVVPVRHYSLVSCVAL